MPTPPPSSSTPSCQNCKFKIFEPVKLPQRGGGGQWGKDFAVVITDLQTGRQSWIIQMVPKYHCMYFYKKGAEKDLTLEEKAT